LDNPFVVRALVLFVILVLSLTQRDSAAQDLQPKISRVARADGSLIEVHVYRPQGRGPLPIVLAIDGSMCMPSTSGFIEFLRSSIAGEQLYALVVVEKPAPTPLPPPDEDGNINLGPEFTCSEEFKQYYSIDQRVLDHLRAVQHLRRSADWWNRDLFVWGFSDGGRVGSHVGAYVPETRRMALGGFGGGWGMAREFADVHMCAADRTKDRPECLRSLQVQFDEIRRNPVTSKTWNGDANTYKAWATRLDAIEANVLDDVTIPLLLYHGELDNAVPVASARATAERLRRRNASFVYREIAGMGHGLGSRLSDEESERLHDQTLDWLLLEATIP
jgi:predicted esterase